MFSNSSFRACSSRCLSLLAMSLVLQGASITSAQVVFNWVTIGDTGNTADTLVMTKCPSTFCTGDGTTGYGSVNYEYEIAAEHVTASQYTEFLNSADPNGTNALNLFDSRMDTFFHPVSFLPVPAYTGSIDFDNSAAAGSKYSAKVGQENFPATWVSWVSAARFVNWLSNGQGTGDTESGVYNNLPVNTTDPIPARAIGAEIFLPTDDEFYKAAYYNPTLNGGSGGYTEYGVGNTAPVVEGPAGGATSANYAQTDGVDGHNGDTYWQNAGGLFDDSLTYGTAVGAYTSATSHYGLYDVDGNAHQWLEATRPNQFGAGDLPVFRGGSWWHGSDGSGAAFRNTQFFATGSSSLSSNHHGLRIARLAPVTKVPGDTDGDGDVDLLDLDALGANFGTLSGATCAEGDFDGDGDVDLLDLDILGANFGTGVPSTSVPEPNVAALAVIACSFCGLYARRRR